MPSIKPLLVWPLYLMPSGKKDFMMMHYHGTPSHTPGPLYDASDHRCSILTITDSDNGRTSDKPLFESSMMHLIESFLRYLESVSYLINAE